MREILFRGKRIDNREWAEDYLYGIGEKKYILYELPNSAPTIGIEVDPETICQYTGLTDKNGKKIWENDILMGHGNREDLARVVYGEFPVIDAETLEAVDKVIGWHYEVIPTDALSKCEPFCLPMPLTDEYVKICEFEVVGNVFDNPELLEV